jgi:hypothetical protein
VRSRLFPFFALLCFLGFAWTLLAWARSYLPPDLHAAVADGRLILVFAQPPATNYWKFRYGNNRETPVHPAQLLTAVRAGNYISPESHTTANGLGVDGRPFVKSLNVPPQVRAAAGVQFITEPMAGTQPYYRMVVIPLLYPAVLLAIPPAVWLALTVRRRRRLRAGLCRNCGYDLRESPERCPECGAAAAPAPVGGARQAAA